MSRLDDMIDDLHATLQTECPTLTRASLEVEVRKILKENKPQHERNVWTAPEEAATSPMWPQQGDEPWGELRPYWIRGIKLANGQHSPPQRVTMVQNYATNRFFCMDLSLDVAVLRDLGYEFGGTLDQEIPVEPA